MFIRMHLAQILMLVHRRIRGRAGWIPPPDAQRCPSKWGAGDTRGSANHVQARVGAGGPAARENR